MTGVEKLGEQNRDQVEISTIGSPVEIRDSTENSTSNNFWVCPDCGKKLTIKYKSGHKRRCKGKPKLKDFERAGKAAKQLDSIKKEEPKLLSELIEGKQEQANSNPIRGMPSDDPRVGFYLQVATVVAVVVAALYIVFRAVTNQPPPLQEEIDTGYTDERGIYYGPGEWHH